MSGGALAFQKLNGPGTQMQNLIDSVNKSDLYKLAREHYPSSNLIPVQRPWEIGINENAENSLSFGGLYFGKWVLNHNSQDVGDTNNGRKRSQSYLKFGDAAVARTMIIVHGDDILAWGTATTEHLGSATSLHVDKLEVDQQPQHGVQVSFIGYRISENPNFNYPANGSIQSDGNIHLSAQDLTSAGYTYQWSATTGTGTFTNPNLPNTVFVPDGNGNYVLQLVVTSPDGVVSAPTDVPVTVDFDQTLTVKNLLDHDLLFYFGYEEKPLLQGQEIKIFGKNGSIGSPYNQFALTRPDAKMQIERTIIGEGAPVVTYYSDIPLNLPYASEPLKDVLIEIKQEIIDLDLDLTITKLDARIAYQQCIYDIVEPGVYPIYFPRQFHFNAGASTTNFRLVDATLGVLQECTAGVEYQNIDILLPDGCTALTIEDF